MTTLTLGATTIDSPLVDRPVAVQALLDTGAVLAFVPTCYLGSDPEFPHWEHSIAVCVPDGPHDRWLTDWPAMEQANIAGLGEALAALALSRRDSVFYMRGLLSRTQRHPHRSPPLNAKIAHLDLTLLANSTWIGAHDPDALFHAMRDLEGPPPLPPLSPTWPGATLGSILVDRPTATSGHALLAVQRTIRAELPIYGRTLRAKSAILARSPHVSFAAPKADGIVDFAP